MTTNITTLLFDLDGTLIDTNELIIQSFLHTFEKYFPGEYSREDVLPFMGPTLWETFSQIDKDNVEKLVEEYRTFNLANHDDYVEEFAGVKDTLKILQEKGYKLGVVTTKKWDTAMKGLKLTGLEEFFDVIVALDHVTKAKPDPEPILLALTKLHSKPEEALMIGDNSHDILGGKNAGTKTAGVAWSLKGRAYLEQFEPDYILENMRDLLSILKVDEE